MSGRCVRVRRGQGEVDAQRPPPLRCQGKGVVDPENFAPDPGSGFKIPDPA